MSISNYLEGIGDLIIATLLSHRSSYSFHKILRELETKRYKEASVRTTLSRLHKKGYLAKSQNGWHVTNKGKKYSRETILFSYMSSPFNNQTIQNTIVAFDIPENDRRKRSWLRNQLKIFGYKMLQQSLWRGPGPLPEKFLDRLKDLEIRKSIKIFFIQKAS